MDGDKLGDVKFSCPGANKIVEKAVLLVEVCAVNFATEKQQQWKKCAELYSVTMEKLKSRKVFNFEDVCDFQDTADDFCELYIQLTGGPSMTNYMHFLSAGHFSFYLLRLGNLYKYSQQGWEHINGIAKRTFNHNTQKGGGRNGSSKLLPIVYSFLRELLWRFKHGDKLFLKYDTMELQKYGETPSQIKVDKDTINLMAKTILNLGTVEDILGLDSDLFEGVVDDAYDIVLGEL